jgi:phospholipid/cholesterol/gamma-HCH transport system substrate-binding protein
MRQASRFVAVIVALAIVGVIAAAAVLYKQRAPIPFRDVYEIKASLTSADGVQPGVGQPVNVAGVKVGSVLDAVPGDDGNATITLQIERDQLPRVYEDATATLAPITPLEDMQINLDPGRPPAATLPKGAVINSGSTSVPTASSELLSALDTDTRGFMASFLGNLQQGTDGRGTDLRQALGALGPTTAQVRRITTALATRRREVSRLVHNLAIVTRAASSDRELATLVSAGNATLEAIARQDAPLRDAIARLPGTLDQARSTLTSAAVFSRDLQPTLTALLPATRGLPATLAAGSDFLRAGTRTLASDVRPLVRRAQPLVADLAPTVTDLRAWVPDLRTTFNVFRYFLNEFAYNPPGDDEGFLFWSAWTFHNIAAVIKYGDAHGPIARVTVLANCSQFASALTPVNQILAAVIGIGSACPPGA